MSHSAQVILAISITATLCLSALGLGAVSVGPFVTPRARIGSTEATGQLSVSFGKLGVSAAIRANGTRPPSFASAMECLCSR
jgi:hypothetical protein